MYTNTHTNILCTYNVFDRLSHDRDYHSFHGFTSLDFQIKDLFPPFNADYFNDFYQFLKPDLDLESKLFNFYESNKKLWSRTLKSIITNNDFC